MVGLRDVRQWSCVALTMVLCWSECLGCDCRLGCCRMWSVIELDLFFNELVLPNSLLCVVVFCFVLFVRVSTSREAVQRIEIDGLL